MADLDDFFTKKDKKKKKKSKKKAAEAAAAATISASNPVATIKTTAGEFSVELFLDRVPLTVSNFVDLAQRKFYSGIAFHRIISDFMLQVGCPNTKSEASRDQEGKGNAPPNSSFTNLLTGETHTRNGAGCIDDECVSRDSNTALTLAMANTGDRDTGGSQFFINVVSNSNLDWFETEQSPGSKHPVFGKLLGDDDERGGRGGERVIAALAKTPVNPKTDRPLRPIRIVDIEVKLQPANQPAREPEPEPEPK